MLQLEVHNSDSVELRQLARQAVGRVSERAHFVLLAAQGYSPPEIGKLLGYDAQTVRIWLKAYQRQRCAGLDDAPRSGRPPIDRHLTAVVQAQASQPPPNSGHLQACWTVALLVLHLATRFRLAVSLSRVRRALHQAGPALGTVCAGCRLGLQIAFQVRGQRSANDLALAGRTGFCAQCQIVK